MRRLVAIGIMALAVTSSVSAGSIYKCTDADGNVTFSQTACPAKASGDQIGYSRPSRHQPTRPQAPGAYDPYSIENQVRKYETDKEKRLIKHKQYELDAENRRRRLKNERTADEINSHVSRRKQNKIDRAKCDLYKSYARKYEYKDEVRHNSWKLNAARACR